MADVLVDGVNPDPNPRPDGARYWTAFDMIDWLKANTKLEDPEYAAKWWVGCKLVEGINDSNTRERVEMIVDGIAPLTLEDVTENLQESYQYAAEDDISAEDQSAELEREWQAFWETRGQV